MAAGVADHVWSLTENRGALGLNRSSLQEMSWARRLAWLAGLALLSLAVVAYLGRTRLEGCDPPPTGAPCDRFEVSPLWAFWGRWSLGALVLVLATMAGIMALRSRRDSN